MNNKRVRIKYTPTSQERHPLYKPTDQERHPLVGFSPVSTLFKLAIFLVVGYMLVYLSFGWSLNETEKLTAYALGSAYGNGGAWLIQLLPQVLLIIRVMIVDRRFRIGLLVAALGVNLIDAATNVSAFLGTPRVAPAEWAPGIEIMALTVGILFAIGITWAEELLAWLIGAGLHLLAMLIAGTGRTPPNWMRVGEIVAKGAAGSPSAQLYPRAGSAHVADPATSIPRAAPTMPRTPGNSTADQRRAAYLAALQASERQQ